MATSNCRPPAATSRVVTWRSVPSSRIVYLTLIPVFLVNSEGVSFAMSFICGLSTMATLIEPPFVPDAGVPPPVDADLLLEPPQPVATTPTTASTAAAHRGPIVPLISVSSCFVGGQRDPSGNAGTYNVGLCWLSRPIRAQSQAIECLPSGSACVYMRACGSTASDQPESGSPGRDRPPRGSSSRL